jgi:hypothetical protein
MLIVSPSYGWYEKSTPEQKELFYNIWPTIKRDNKSLAEWVEAEDKAAYHHWSAERLMWPEYMELFEGGIAMTAEPYKGTMLTRMHDRITADEKYGDKARMLMNGHAVQITIPDFALMAIKNVTWLDDACTEDVQKKLDDGWRILAVCPPNNARRPDYILGR